MLDFFTCTSPGRMSRWQRLRVLLDGCVQAKKVFRYYYLRAKAGRCESCSCVTDGLNYIGDHTLESESKKAWELPPGFTWRLKRAENQTRDGFTIFERDGIVGCPRCNPDGEFSADTTDLEGLLRRPDAR